MLSLVHRWLHRSATGRWLELRHVSARRVPRTSDCRPAEEYGIGTETADQASWGTEAHSGSEPARQVRVPNCRHRYGRPVRVEARLHVRRSMNSRRFFGHGPNPRRSEKRQISSGPTSLHGDAAVDRRTRGHPAGAVRRRLSRPVGRHRASWARWLNGRILTLRLLAGGSDRGGSRSRGPGQDPGVEAVGPRRVTRTDANPLPGAGLPFRESHVVLGQCPAQGRKRPRSSEQAAINTVGTADYTPVGEWGLGRTASGRKPCDQPWPSVHLRPEIGRHAFRQRPERPQRRTWDYSHTVVQRGHEGRHQSPVNDPRPKSNPYRLVIERLCIRHEPLRRMGRKRKRPRGRPTNIWPTGSRTNRGTRANPTLTIPFDHEAVL